MRIETSRGSKVELTDVLSTDTVVTFTQGSETLIAPISSIETGSRFILMQMI